MSHGADRPPYKIAYKRPSFSVQPVMRDGRLMMVRIEKRIIPSAPKPEAEPFVRPPMKSARLQGRLAQDVAHLLRTRPSALWDNKK